MLMQEQHYDVVICGAGPAGLTAALALHNSDLRVLLLEKGDNSTEKICGGALAPYIPKVLNTIDPAFSDAFHQWAPKQPVNTCRVSSSMKNAVDFIFSQTGWICKRSDFDKFLLELVLRLPNVTYMAGKKVIDVTQHGNSIKVRTQSNETFSGTLLIACDGAGSITKKKLLNTGLNKKHHATAVRAYFSGVQGMNENTFELHFLKQLNPGYLWIFPINKTLTNVGIGLPTKTVISKRMNMKKLLKQIIEDHPILKQRFSKAFQTTEIIGSGLPLNMSAQPISGDRFMLCGDAGSLIDPLTGEGIGQAMVSGRYAGWQAIECFKQHQFHGQFMKQYDEVVNNKLLNTHLRHAALIKKIDRFPFLLSLGLYWAKHSKSFHQRVIQHFEV